MPSFASGTTYTITYEYRGATSGNTRTTDTYIAGSVSPITLPTPSKTGSTFLYWNIDPVDLSCLYFNDVTGIFDIGGKYRSYVPGCGTGFIQSTVRPLTNVTLYALYETKVTYYPNGGTFTRGGTTYDDLSAPYEEANVYGPENSTVNVPAFQSETLSDLNSKAYNISADTFNTSSCQRNYSEDGQSCLTNELTMFRDGYSFTGWNTSADGTGTSYDDVDYYDFSAPMNLYAQWRSNNPPLSNDSSSETYFIKKCHGGLIAKIQFAPNKYNLTKKNISELQSVINLYKDSGCSKINVIGYTSKRALNPTPLNIKYREKISKERAKSVEEYLKKNLIDPVTFSRIGRSASNPISSNKSEKTRKPNRRVEIWFE